MIQCISHLHSCPKQVVKFGLPSLSTNVINDEIFKGLPSLFLYVVSNQIMDSGKIREQTKAIPYSHKQL